jgi:hypothetical protein
MMVDSRPPHRGSGPDRAAAGIGVFNDEMRVQIAKRRWLAGRVVDRRWPTAGGDLAAWMNATPKVVLSTDSSHDVGAWDTRHWPPATERIRFAA